MSSLDLARLLWSTPCLVLRHVASFVMGSPPFALLVIRFSLSPVEGCGRHSWTGPNFRIMAPRPRNRATVRTRSFSAVVKSVAFPYYLLTSAFQVSLSAGSPGRVAQAQILVARKWPQAESVVIRTSQAVPGSETDRRALDVSLVSQTTWVGTNRS